MSAPLQLDVLSPHRDDAAYSLAETIQVLAGQGWRVRVVNVFTISDFSLDPPLRDTATVSAMRDQEDRNFAAQLGPAIILENLSRLDAPLRQAQYREQLRRQGDFGTAEITEQQALARQLRALWARETPAAVALPLGLGSHVDHRIALQAGLDAALAPLLFYEDLPHASLVSMPDIDAHVEKLARARGVQIRPLLVGDGGEAQLARKLRLVNLYRSQLCPFVTEGIASYAARLGGRERLWITAHLGLAPLERSLCTTQRLN